MRHKYLLEKITRRGPKAFAIFSSILMTKFPDAYDYFNHLETVYGDISLTRSRPNARSNSGANLVNNNSVAARREPPPVVVVRNGNDAAATPIERGQSPPTTSTPNGSTSNGSTANGSITNGSTPNGSTANGSQTEDVYSLKEFTVPVKSRHNFRVHKSAKFHGVESGSKVSTYPMRSLNRGVLFLVNIVHFDQHNKKRNGADADRDNLIALFREMGFKIFYYENLKRDVSWIVLHGSCNRN